MTLYTVERKVAPGVRIEAILDVRVRVLLTLIHDSDYSRAALETVSASVNLSVSRLCHLFTEQVGLGPLQYAKALRLEKARDLVESTFLRIQEIEVTLGFKDSTRFGKDFKVAYGLTPAKHRVRHRTEAAKHD
jgi:transcriptional regulator GlxA family with amidase domain